MMLLRVCVGAAAVAAFALYSATGFAAEAPTKPPKGTAPASTAKQDAESPPDKPPAKVRVGGYLKPGAGVRYRADALPKDRLEYGFTGGAGLSVVAEPFPYWSGRLKLQFSSSVFSAVTGVKLFDLGGSRCSRRCLGSAIRCDSCHSSPSLELSLVAESAGSSARGDRPEYLQLHRLPFEQATAFGLRSRTDALLDQS